MPRFLADGEGVTSCGNNLVGKHFEKFSRCSLDPITKNSVLSGLGFNFLETLLKTKLNIYVIGTNKTSKQDFNNTVGIRIKIARFARWIYNYVPHFISSSRFKRSDLTVGDLESGILWMSLVKFIRIFSILSLKNFENDSESDFISEKAGINGDSVLWRILFIVSEVFVDYLRFHWYHLHTIYAVHRLSFYYNNLPVFCTSIYLGMIESFAKLVLTFD